MGLGWCSKGDRVGEAHGGAGHVLHYKQRYLHHYHQASSDGEENQAPEGAGPPLPQVQLHQHQVLLLQQLQPNTAQVLLQDLQEVLD